MESVSTSKAPAAIGPYSQAIRTGSLLFTSMQIPLDPDTGSIPEGIRKQTALVLANLRAIALAAGTSLQHAVRITVYIKDLSEFQTMNEVYSTFFVDNPPARAAVEVARIPKDALVAMDAIFEIPS